METELKTKILTFSKARKDNPITEEEAVKIYAGLRAVALQGASTWNSVLYEETKRAEVKLKEHSAFVIAQVIDSNKFIGCSFVSEDKDSLTPLEQGECGGAYVIPEYRKKGVFGQILQGILEIAAVLDYQRVIAYPNKYSRGVFINKGFVLAEDYPQYLTTEGEKGYIKFL